MPLPTITGLPDTIDLSKMLNSLTMRYEHQGAYVSLVVADEHEKPAGDVVIGNETLSLVRRRVRISPNAVDTTTYSLRPKGPENTLFWMQEDMFLQNLQRIIIPNFVDVGSEIVGGDGGDVFSADGSSWAAIISALSILPDGVTATYGDVARISDGTALAAILLADLDSISATGIKAFIQASDELADYGLGVDFETGELYNLDDAELHTLPPLHVNEFEFEDDSTDYQALAIGCRYLAPSLQELQELVLPSRNGDIFWVDQDMPSLPRARLEITLNRRRLELAARTVSMTFALETELRPRRRFDYRGHTWHPTRVAHQWLPGDRHDITEVEAWRVS